MLNLRGAILLIVLIVILSISLLGATLAALFYNVLVSSQIELDRARALYLAEAGIARAISLLRTQAGTAANASSEQIIPSTKFGEGKFEVYNDFLQSSIISIGESHGLRRSIQLKYNAF